jgi:hypothetical protein
MNLPAAILATAICILVPCAATADAPSDAKNDRKAAHLARSAIGGATTDSFTCPLPSPLPVAPPGGLAAGTFNGGWASNDGFAVIVWREPCATGAITYLRVVPTAGAPFICSSAFVVLQNFTQYDIKLSQTANGSSFCNDLFAPVTTAIDQYSFDPKFDQSAAFALVYEGVYQNFTGNVSAINGTPFKPWVTIELSTLEDSNMRGAVNYYNANPSAPFLRLVMEERTFARYSSLATQLGMAVPPPR